MVITTKKGKAGHTSWALQTEAGALDDRNTYPITYANWGHLPGTTAPVLLGFAEKVLVVVRLINDWLLACPVPVRVFVLII